MSIFSTQYKHVPPQRVSEFEHALKTHYKNILARQIHDDALKFDLPKINQMFHHEERNFFAIGCFWHEKGDPFYLEEAVNGWEKEMADRYLINAKRDYDGDFYHHYRDDFARDILLFCEKHQMAYELDHFEGGRLWSKEFAMMTDVHQLNLSEVLL